MLPCSQEQQSLGSGQPPGVTEGAAVHLLHDPWKVSRCHSRHQLAALLQICTHSVQHLLWYIDDSLVPKKCSEVRFVGRIIHLAKDGTHRSSETLVMLVPQRWQLGDGGATHEHADSRFPGRASNPQFSQGGHGCLPVPSTL
jgi:hypothetical protein